MLPNINPSTGVRYGIVSLDSLAEWAGDEFLVYGTNESFIAALDEARGGGDWLSEAVFEEEYEEDEDVYSLELAKDGLKLQLSYLGGAPLVWVLESAHTTRARLCSPCVPNGGDLDSLDEGGFVCYTLPPEWFREEEE